MRFGILFFCLALTSISSANSLNECRDRQIELGKAAGFKDPQIMYIGADKTVYNSFDAFSKSEGFKDFKQQERKVYDQQDLATVQEKLFKAYEQRAELVRKDRESLAQPQQDRNFKDKLELSLKINSTWDATRDAYMKDLEAFGDLQMAQEACDTFNIHCDKVASAHNARKSTKAKLDKAMLEQRTLAVDNPKLTEKGFAVESEIKDLERRQEEIERKINTADKNSKTPLAKKVQVIVYDKDQEAITKEFLNTTGNDLLGKQYSYGKRPEYLTRMATKTGRLGLQIESDLRAKYRSELTKINQQIADSGIKSANFISLNSQLEDGKESTVAYFQNGKSEMGTGYNVVFDKDCHTELTTGYLCENNKKGEYCTPPEGVSKFVEKYQVTKTKVPSVKSSQDRAGKR